MCARLRHGREVLRRSDGVRAESQRALDGLKGEFEALTRELTAEGGAAAASWSAASSGLPHGARLPVVSVPWLVNQVPVFAFRRPVYALRRLPHRRPPCSTRLSHHPHHSTLYIARTS